jgi:hypothetical protein
MNIIYNCKVTYFYLKLYLVDSLIKNNWKCKVIYFYVKLFYFWMDKINFLLKNKKYINL